MMKYLYIAFAAFSLLLFGYFEFTGVTLTKPETYKNVNLAQNNTVRNNPGTRRNHYTTVFISRRAHK